MPISLSQLRDRKASITIDLGDSDKIVAEYFPHKITPGYLDEASRKNDLMALADTVAEFVADWDIETEPGVKLPVTREGAAQLGIALLNMIVTEVAQDIRNPLAVKRNAKR